MNDCHFIGTILVLAWGKIDPEREWSMDEHAFATAVDIHRPHNSVAQKFFTADGPAGRQCSDFRQLTTTLLYSGLVQYISPQYTHMKAWSTPRMAVSLKARVADSLAMIDEAVALLKTHWNLANGKHYECIECQKPAVFIRHTQFAGSHEYCHEHAVKEPDFNVSDGQYKVWEAV